jgi:hypothetical protein
MMVNWLETSNNCDPLTTLIPSRATPRLYRARDHWHWGDQKGPAAVALFCRILFHFLFIATDLFITFASEIRRFVKMPSDLQYKTDGSVANCRKVVRVALTPHQYVII